MADHPGRVGTPPTLADVAELAGVSRQTVSNAVNNPDLLRPDTLERVQQAIAQLANDDFGGWTADAFHLYQSQLRTGGSVYTKMASYSFSK